MNREQVERLTDAELNLALCMALGVTVGGIPNYASSLDDAWRLLPWTPYWVDATAPDLGIDFEFHLLDGRDVKATGATLAQARARAALLVMTNTNAPAPAAPEGREGK
jgi:hypothetical protein